MENNLSNPSLIDIHPEQGAGFLKQKCRRENVPGFVIICVDFLRNVVETAWPDRDFVQFKVLDKKSFGICLEAGYLDFFIFFRRAGARVRNAQQYEKRRPDLYHIHFHANSVWGDSFLVFDARAINAYTPSLRHRRTIRAILISTVKFSRNNFILHGFHRFSRSQNSTTRASSMR